jgi:hypothetical protein
VSACRLLTDRSKCYKISVQEDGALTVRLISACAAHSFFFASSKLVRGATDTGTSLLARQRETVRVLKRAAPRPVFDGALLPQGVVCPQVAGSMAIPEGPVKNKEGLV